MFEKVNPSHPDKVADRIAGALVDLAYEKEHDPRIAVEVLIGHGVCTIIAETSVHLDSKAVYKVVKRIAGYDFAIDYIENPQDEHLAENQQGKIRCGDNGIFKGVPETDEEQALTRCVYALYEHFPFDGKCVFDSRDGRLIVCQSCASENEIREMLPGAQINPLGYWTGGTNTDTGAVNRKLGSDMGGSVTGGGLHGKDLSKADVSVNIYAWLKAQETGKPVELCCAIGDETIDGKPYSEIVEIARSYIKNLGGFERFAEWGLLRYKP